MNDPRAMLASLAQRFSDFRASSTITTAANQWQRASDALAVLIELPESDRAAGIATIAGGDAALRAELEALLRAHLGSSALDAPVLDVVAVAPQRAEPSLPAWSGEVIGARYHVLDDVVGGSMGVVVKALDDRLERVVALKFLSAHLLENVVARERFRVEARAIASLDHPNVCAIYDMGDASDDRFFISMPYYRGETIAAKLARGPLPIADVVSFARQTANGLAAAHARGIIHRDIKPANIIVTTDGVVKILDFGIAKLSGSPLTAPGFTPGTVSYMSPEQTRADPTDARTDIWSLGVVMYVMLAGTRPFRGADAREVAASICTEEPATISAQREGVPSALERMVTAALAKQRENRPVSALRMADALEGVAS
ncbi:MAG: serine/threonine protein kinase [Gemmatimonadota bacterium]|nr:serine/threonine protein kinase [Gemmatimonadota bacterium]